MESGSAVEGGGKRPNHKGVEGRRGAWRGFSQGSSACLVILGYVSDSATVLPGGRACWSWCQWVFFSTLTWRCGGIENRTLYMNSGSDVKIRFPFGMCGRGKEGCDGGGDMVAVLYPTVRQLRPGICYHHPTPPARHCIHSKPQR